MESTGGTGRRCEAVVYDGGTHGFFNRSPYREQTIARMEQFLESIGWLVVDANGR